MAGAIFGDVQDVRYAEMAGAIFGDVQDVRYAGAVSGGGSSPVRLSPISSC
ncbi:hypothetical protein [Rheinheimera sp.]|uniref:hypothetical protein n=1 Tax=Rheinheimera sp. TaxID=1869214 RepID=UPI00307E8ECE